jgi:hypothetical protein
MPIVPVTQEVEIRRLMVQVQSMEKVSETSHLNNKPGMVVYACHPSYAGGMNRRIAVQSSLGKTSLFKKNNLCKKDGGHGPSGRAPAWQV